MPSLLAHSLAGEVALLKSQISKLNQIIVKNKPQYYVGCQGPDIFLYYHNLPWQSHKSYGKIHQLASVSHEEKVNDCFQSLLTQAKETMDDSLISYVCGYMAHHCLDRNAHPYVYYCTDSCDKDIGYSHQLFESQLELGILNEYKLDVKQYNITERIRKIKKKNSIVAALVKMTKEVYQCQLTDKEVADCLDDTAFVAGFLRDTNGKKTGFISALEKIFSLEGLATSMIVPKEYDNALDAMNYRQSVWCHPCDNSLKSTDGFVQLFSTAVNELVAELELFEKYLFNDGSIDDLLAIIGNKSFATGKSDGSTMKFFKKDEKEGANNI
ncbi:MAG: zinc dependent phospholipase C family protein [Erysipelotrichaceae bacterium]